MQHNQSTEVKAHQRKRLRIGTILSLPRSGFVRVTKVTNGSAHVVPLAKKQVSVVSRLYGRTKTFLSSQQGWDISRNADVDVVDKSNVFTRTAREVE